MVVHSLLTREISNSIPKLGILGRIRYVFFLIQEFSGFSLFTKPNMRNSNLICAFFCQKLTEKQLLIIELISSDFPYFCRSSQNKKDKNITPKVKPTLVKKKSVDPDIVRRQNKKTSLTFYYSATSADEDKKKNQTTPKLTIATILLRHKVSQM